MVIFAESLRKVSHTHTSYKVGISSSSRYDKALQFDKSKLVNRFPPQAKSTSEVFLLDNTFFEVEVLVNKNLISKTELGKDFLSIRVY